MRDFINNLCFAVLIFSFFISACDFSGSRKSARAKCEPSYTGSDNDASEKVAPVNVMRVAPHPDNPYIIYALDEFNGVFKSENGGRAWKIMNSGLDICTPDPEWVYYGELVINDKSPEILYTLMCGRIFKSTDGAASWNFIGEGTESYEYGTNIIYYFINDIVIDPINENTLYAGSIVGGATGGFFKSTDAGDSWELIAGNTIPGSGIGNDASPIVVDPSNNLQIYAGSVHSIFYKSSDGGYHWTRSDPVDGKEGSVLAMGLNSKKLNEVFIGVGIFSPNDDTKSYVSNDSGASWQEAADIEGAIQSIRFAPSDASAVYAISTTLLSYDFDYTTRLLFRSRDNGVTWENLGSHALGLRTVTVNPSDPNHIYLGTVYGGMLESCDGGDDLTVFQTETKN